MQRYKLLAVTTFVGALALAATALAQTTLPLPDPPFSLTPADSVKDFPKEMTAPEGAPNTDE